MVRAEAEHTMSEEGVGLLEGAEEGREPSGPGTAGKPGASSSNSGSNGGGAYSLEASIAAELEAIYKEEKVVSIAKIGWLTTVFAVVLAVNVSKGGGGFPSPFGMRCGSPGYW